MEQFNLPERKCFARIEKKPVNYYQRVCWYYNELNEEARKFIDVYIKKSESFESIISSVLHRFKRECKNTNSENFIIYTTLAESLYNHELTDVLGIKEVKHELESFSIADITDEQLTKEEQEKLSERIKHVLTKLNMITS
ncbi:Imm3 family immunity protein [Lysinibacillus sp. OF-1]|uniref:Imm3 family immunity protein n=1 Tax=Lysinibacillus sp. OF-1 TaxID=2972483 RepID=UPI003FA5D21A